MSSEDARHTTRKGRVVYNRKKHIYGISDFHRMSKKLSISKATVSAEVFDDWISCIRSLDPVAVIPSGFGGGHFGGAGASGTFADGIEIGRIVVIMEGK